jgi:hypothetical protein
MFVKGEVKKLSLPVNFRWMEVSGNKQSTWLCLDTSHLFLRVANKFLMVLVILYNETFQAWVVEWMSFCFHNHFWISVLTVFGEPTWDCIMVGEYNPNVRCLQHSEPQSVCSYWLVVCFSAHRKWKTVHTFSLVCLFSGGCCYSVDAVFDVEFPLLVNIPAALQWDQVA